MKKIKNVLLFALTSLFFISCQFFDADVTDFMEKYTETAGVEEHTYSVEPYLDKDNHYCISSQRNFEINLFMRNPKKFSMVPSVTFPDLDPSIDVSQVTIEQTAFDSLKMVFPQEFLLAADEGKNITTDIRLYEPMSGRTFAGYDIKLNCDTIPPQIETPTVINYNGTSFVLAFDMPPADELALRNKDISSIVINGTEYPVSVASDGSFTFSDSSFTRTFDTSFIFINSKEFTHSSRSVYFYTGEPFVQGDKEYTIGLKDRAGLIKTLYTSTSISRLKRAVVKDIDNVSYPTGSDEMVSGSSSNPFKLYLIPPTEDHKNNPVPDTTIHYFVYKGTSTVSALVQEGVSNSQVELSLEEGTYHIEVYATKTNYEQSATTSVNFRIVDNAIFVSDENGDNSYDGTRDLPFKTLARAISDIAVRNMPNAHMTIYVDGNVKGCTEIDATATRSITITSRPGHTGSLDGENLGTTVKVTTEKPVIFKNITIKGGNGNLGGNGGNGGGIYITNGTNVTLKENAIVKENTAVNGGGIYSVGTLNLESGAKVTDNTATTDGAGIYSNGPSTAKGFVTVTGNKVGTADSNFYLETQPITIKGALTDGTNNSQIGITTLSDPDPLTAVPITTDYGYNAGGYNAGVHPGTYFISDRYAINKDDSTGEATVFINSGTFDDILSNLNFTFTASPDEFTVGTATTITVTPTVTYGPGATPIDYSTLESRVTWLIKLKNSGTDVSGVTSTTNTITIPATVVNPDSYKLYIKVIVDGLYPYDREIDITGIL